jgi:hypothetical protein
MFAGWTSLGPVATTATVVRIVALRPMTTGRRVDKSVWNVDKATIFRQEICKQINYSAKMCYVRFYFSPFPGLGSIFSASPLSFLSL